MISAHKHDLVLYVPMHRHIQEEYPGLFIFLKYFKKLALKVTDLPMLFSHIFHGSLILLHLPHLAGHLPTPLKYSSFPFVLFPCASFPLKAFYSSLVGLSLVPWPWVTLILVTRYIYLTVSSQVCIWARECLSFWAWATIFDMYFPVCVQDLLWGFLCECNCPHEWQVCGGQSTAAGLSSHEARVITENTRGTRTVTRAACSPS